MNIKHELAALAVAIAYMLVILFIWIDADLRGQTYFSAGEPRVMIKYTEWALGIMSVIVMMRSMKEKLQQYAERS